MGAQALLQIPEVTHSQLSTSAEYSLLCSELATGLRALLQGTLISTYVKKLKLCGDRI